MSVELRGGMFTSLRSYVQQKNIALYQEIMVALEPSTKKIFDDVIVYKDFYPISAYQNFLQAFYQRVSEEDYVASSEHLAKRDLRGLFLVFARLLSKEFLVKRMSTLWNKVVSGATVTLLKNTKNSVGISVEGLAYTDSHRIHTEHYIRTMLESATGKKHRSESKQIDENTCHFWYYDLSSKDHHRSE